jgi:hypothetical protein
MAKRKRHYGMVDKRDSGQYRQEGVDYRRDGEYMGNESIERYRPSGKSFRNYDRGDGDYGYRSDRSRDPAYVGREHRGSEYSRNDTMENFGSRSRFDRSDANGSYKRSKDLETREGRMIHDDWNSPSLLPRQVIDKYYGSDYHYVEQTQPDLYTGVERQLRMDREAFDREFYPHKE